MLHEVLLALSGHPSPLFGEYENGQTSSKDLGFPLLSPSERALLQSIGELSRLHRKLKQHLESIASEHASVICRSVATSIQQTHLTRFHQHILDVESNILQRDASVVGAYDIVPLATVVGKFDDWHRRMAWYWNVASFMSADRLSNRSTTRPEIPCSSARLMDKLRNETQTGFPDIEKVANELLKIAETAWLRQLASWLVYGKLPAFGAGDFFIQIENAEERVFKKEKALLPRFVTSITANSMLFVGKSLDQVQCLRQYTSSSLSATKAPQQENTLATDHLQRLSNLSVPIISTQLSRTVADIRLSLSQNVLQNLMPMTVTLRVLSCIRGFFLMQRGSFATALIVESESRIKSRQQSMGRLLQQDPMKALKGLNIKDAEFAQALQQVWKGLASADSEDVDEVLEYARNNIVLASPRPNTSRPTTAESTSAAGAPISTIAFNDLLFPTPCELSLNITSPLDLFLSSGDITTYSAINSYLLAIRRGHQKLSELWRNTPARRDHPISSAQDAEMRQRHKRRAAATRKLWATCSAAVFLLSETSAFFEGEIVKGSYDHFHTWVQEPAYVAGLDTSMISTKSAEEDATAQKDPETLASGHRAFLRALTYALLLTDIPYTHELRSLLRNIDNLIAFFNRLLDMQMKLDLEHQANGESAHTAEEAQRIALELDRARKRVDSDIKMVVNRLRQLDHERIGSMRYLDSRPMEHGDFEIWKGGGVDRLLMKLDSGRIPDELYDIV